MILCMSQTNGRILVENIRNCNFASNDDSRGICNPALPHALEVPQMRINLLQQAKMTDLHLTYELALRNIMLKIGLQEHS